MKIVVNGQPHEVDKGTHLLALLQRLGIGEKGVAIAIGGRVIVRANWCTHILAPDEEITIIRATCGG